MRLAAPIAASAMPSPSASVAMWPASESSAKRVGGEADHDLHHEESGDQDERDRQPARVACPGSRSHMCVVVAHTTSLTHGAATKSTSRGSWKSWNAEAEARSPSQSPRSSCVEAGYRATR